jgi:hypothetical protein
MAASTFLTGVPGKGIRTFFSISRAYTPRLPSFISGVKEKTFEIK